MSHNVAVKLGLIGKPDPALAEISQELGLRLALWQAQQATETWNKSVPWWNNSGSTASQTTPASIESWVPNE